MVSKRNKKIFHVTIIRPDGTETDVTRYIPYPVEWRDTLDETYDEATFELKHTPFSEEFTPNDIALVKVGKKEQRYVIMSDTVTTLFAINKWNHTLMLCEETQLLERYPAGGGKCFTQPLVRDYTKTEALWLETIRTTTTGGINTNNQGVCLSETYRAVYSLKETTALTLFPLEKIGTFTALGNGSSIRVAIKNYITSEVIFGPYQYSFGNTWSKTVSLDNVKPGQYVVSYNYTGTNGSHVKVDVNFSLLKKAFFTTHTDLTVYEAGKRLCETSEAITVGEKPRFTFSRYSSDGKVDYATVKCPEISISNSRMLWEAMCELARCVHAIPRLYAGGEIKFDRLGRKEKAVIPYRPISEFVSASGERYCGSVDTIAQNLVPSSESGRETVSAPLSRAWMTVRSESGEVRITDANAMIATEYPIYRIAKLYATGVKDTNGNMHVDVDITKYVFEASEYRTLTTSGGYPLGKPYALCYTEGSQNITGLLYKDENALLDVLETHAIYNILTAACGSTVDVHSTAVVDLAFRVEYVPIVTARVKASKSDLASHATEYVLPFNQTSDRMSAKAFSENLRGTLKRYSAAEKKLSYLYFNLDKLPEVGQKFDDTYYINDMTVSLRNHQYAAVTLGLSKHYNALGKHMTLPSEIRQYEISEKNVQDRYVVVEEYVLVTKSAHKLNQYQPARFLRDIDLMLRTADGVYSDAVCVNSVMYDGNKEVVSDVLLPVVSVPLANSAVYSWRYKDNYSAGVMSINPDTETAESITVNKDGSWGGRIVQCLSGVPFYRKQREVEYGDLYGEAHSMGFALIAPADKSDLAKDQEKSTLIGNALPGTVEGDIPYYKNGTLQDRAMVMTANDNEDNFSCISKVKSAHLTPVVLHKDSRETVHCTYQLNFVSDEGLILGDGFPKLCRGIRHDINDRTLKAYFFNEKIDEVLGARCEDALNPDGARVGTLGAIGSVGYLYVGKEDLAYYLDHQAWAIIDSLGNFLVGANSPMALDDNQIFLGAVRSLETVDKGKTVFTPIEGSTSLMTSDGVCTVSPASMNAVTFHVYADQNAIYRVSLYATADNIGKYVYLKTSKGGLFITEDYVGLTKDTDVSFCIPLTKGDNKLTLWHENAAGIKISGYEATPLSEITSYIYQRGDIEFTPIVVSNGESQGMSKVTGCYALRAKNGQSDKIVIDVSNAIEGRYEIAACLCCTGYLVVNGERVNAYATASSSNGVEYRLLKKEIDTRVEKTIEITVDPNTASYANIGAIVLHKI